MHEGKRGLPLGSTDDLAFANRGTGTGSVGIRRGLANAAMEGGQMQEIPGLTPGGFVVFPLASYQWQGDSRGAKPADISAGASPLPPTVPLLRAVQAQVALHRRVLVARLACLGQNTGLLREALSPDRSKGALLLLPPTAAWHDEGGSGSGSGSDG